jgi:hypothetical protein
MLLTPEEERSGRLECEWWKRKGTDRQNLSDRRLDRVAMVGAARRFRMRIDLAKDVRADELVGRVCKEEVAHYAESNDNIAIPMDTTTEVAKNADKIA